MEKWYAFGWKFDCIVCDLRARTRYGVRTLVPPRVQVEIKLFDKLFDVDNDISDDHKFSHSRRSCYSTGRRDDYGAIESSRPLWWESRLRRLWRRIDEAGRLQ
jgi:hypothetical protein